MKDEYLGIARTVFAVALACAIGAYAYFLYPPLREAFADLKLEYAALENERRAIGDVMLDPGAVEGRIAAMRAEIDGMRKVGGLTADAAAGDIMGHMGRLGIARGTVALGEPETLMQEAGDPGRQLLSLPLTIRCRSAYDGGMYLIAALEDSDAGTYVIDDFSFVAAEGDGAEGVLDWTISARLICRGGA
ncbi:MAG: hypothetical protein LBS32_05970 [Clostridiales Family XIII bacterium]|jgi:hypothetical protein|nr:hypothetical protein [Clostridiales Family XIII bacterium]